jgi:hypothetical protein
MNAKWTSVKDRAIPKDRPVLLVARTAKIVDATLKSFRVVGQWSRHAQQFLPVEIPSLWPSGVPTDLIPTHWAELPDFPDNVPENLRG